MTPRLSLLPWSLHASVPAIPTIYRNMNKPWLLFQSDIFCLSCQIKIMSMWKRKNSNIGIKHCIPTTVLFCGSYLNLILNLQWLPWIKSFDVKASIWRNALHFSYVNETDKDMKDTMRLKHCSLQSQQLWHLFIWMFGSMAKWGEKL